MNQTDYANLEKSLAGLQAQYQNFLTLEAQNLSTLNQRAVKNSVTKCFEICYDTFWKHLKKYLEEQGIPSLPNSPKGIFRIANENALIDNAKAWVGEPHGYIRLRINTAHDYSLAKAEPALAKIGDL